MKYKVGDRVRIKSLDWYNKNKDKHGIVICGMMPFCGYMSCRCGTIVTVSEILEWGYCIEEDCGENGWTDEMIEGLVEKEIIDIDDFQDDNEIIDVIDEYVHRLKDNECQINLPEGYQFTDENGNVINATKIVLEKKKKEYPKTYAECCKIMDIDTGFLLTSYDLDFWKGHLLTSLQKLLICRDAYLKLYGEEIGLGKPWKPDWEDKIYYVYYERHRQYGIGIKKAYSHCGIRGNRILVFPTEEMVNAFYENFKELIESVKELL